MRYIILTILSCALVIGCNQVAEKAKDGINQAGDAAGQVMGQFGKGVKEGANKSFNLKIETTPAFKAKKLGTGQAVLESDSLATDNIVAIYIIFDADYKGNLQAKAFNEQGAEMGRSTANADGKKGEAKYVSFTFDKRANLSENTKVVLD